MRLLDDSSPFIYRDLSSSALHRESLRENFTDKTRIVVINMPGNPLGNVLTADDVAAIDRIVAGRAVIINDEIYANTYFDEPSRSVLQLKGSRFMRERGIASSLDPAERIIRSTNVATVPGSDFGIPETLRLSCSSGRYEEGIDRLVGFFRVH